MNKTTGLFENSTPEGLVNFKLAMVGYFYIGVNSYPDKVRVDNDLELTSSEFMNWADQNNISIDYIQSGCPYQNAYIERFNRTYREEVLD